MVNG
jgi:alpha-glucosidase